MCGFAPTRAAICKPPAATLAVASNTVITRAGEKCAMPTNTRVLRDFGLALPKLRKQLEALLAAPGFSRDKVMATVITLLDATLIRVGNTQYARDNRSYGLTTLRNRHVEVNGSAILFQFRGKSGIEHQITVKDRRLARIIKRCLEIPGQKPLSVSGRKRRAAHHQFLRRQRLLKDADRRRFHRKGLPHLGRQCVGIGGAARVAVGIGSRREAACGGKWSKNVARQLGNTPAVCRKCYIHPAVVDGFMQGALSKTAAIKRT